MQALLKKILAQLATHPTVNIFDREILRVFPVIGQPVAAKKKQKEAIEAFAAANGLKASVADAGCRVCFKKLPSEVSPAGVE